MPWPKTVVAGWLVACMVFLACGGVDGDGPDLTVYAGKFSVIGTFKEQNGSGCPPPAEQIENSVTIEIEKSDFESRFGTRWGTLYGHINDDASFMAVDNEPEPDESLEMTGEFIDENGFSGLIKESWLDCTRWTNLLADRIVPE